jgi:hypothetical protein
VAETGAEILARINPQLDEDWVEICLRPDLVAELEELYSELLDAETQDAQRPARNTGVAPSDWTIVLAQQVEAARYLIEESAVRFVFRGLPKDKFRALCDEHPPRPNDATDAYVGYDRVSLGDALVRASLLEPVFDAESWPDLVKVIAVGEWNRMRQYAEKVNGSVVTEAPKAPRASAILSSVAAG